MIEQIKVKLRESSNPEKIPFLKNYLKSPYSFYGIKVPDSRNIAKEYRNLGINEVYNLFDELWNSGNHEEMSLAIHILQQYKKEFDSGTWKFLKARINKAVTWDHIDWLATDIFSEILVKDLRFVKEVKELANSRNHWERRLSIESTYKLIKEGKIELTLLLAEKLVYDENMYVQKGAGWMLREAGKRNRMAVREFIMMHLDMKPVAFSYATETSEMKFLRVLRKQKFSDKMKELRKIRKEKIKQEMGSVQHASRVEHHV